MKIHFLWRGRHFGKGSMHYFTLARGTCVFLHERGQRCSMFVYLCVFVWLCACGANLSGACQKVLVVCSPSSGGSGDVHPRLSASLLFKSQWDTQKLSAIRTCRGQVAAYCVRMVTSFADVTFYHGCWTEEATRFDLIMTEYRLIKALFLGKVTYFFSLQNVSLAAAEWVSLSWRVAQQ